MTKNQPPDVSKSGDSEGKVAKGQPKRLKYSDVKAIFEGLKDLPMGAVLPDLSRLTIGNRFAVALRFVPSELRERVLGRKRKQIDRYASSDAANDSSPGIPPAVVVALAEYSKLPLDWIETGRPMERAAPIIRGMAEDATPFDYEDVPLQKLAFKAAAGPGALMLDDTAGYVRFPRAILAHIGVSPQNARLMEAAGESMRPTINDGDMMLVDVSTLATAIVEGKIYVFSLDDEAYVKRLRRAAGAVIMISDNRDMFPPEEVPQESTMRIYGRVMWAGRSL